MKQFTKGQTVQWMKRDLSGIARGYSGIVLGQLEDGLVAVRWTGPKGGITNEVNDASRVVPVEATAEVKKVAVAKAARKAIERVEATEEAAK